jgi:hypothetical protein
VKRIITALTVAAIMVAMVVASAGNAFALAYTPDTGGPSQGTLPNRPKVTVRRTSPSKSITRWQPGEVQRRTLTHQLTAITSSNEKEL